MQVKNNLNIVKYLIIIQLMTLIVTTPIALTANTAGTCAQLFSHERIEQPLPVRASLPNRVVSRAVEFTIMVLTEYLSAGINTTVAFRDRWSAKKAIEVDTGKKNNLQFSELFESIGEELKIDFENTWETDAIWAARYGTALISSKSPDHISIENLKNHFRKVLPTPLADTAILTIEAFNNKDQIKEWMNGLKVEVIMEMWNDGIRDAETFKNHTVRELYLDKVLMRRAAKHGFSGTKNSLPSNLITFNPWIFFRLLLGQKKLFIDWTGTDLQSNNTGAAHYARGHTLAMTYAAEYVPGFDKLMQHTGKTMDAAGIWKYLFDNSDSTETPFWSGKWVADFGTFLGIKY